MLIYSVDFADLLARASQVYTESGEASAAIDLLEKAVALKPEDHRPYLLSAYIHFQEGELNRAFKNYKQALKLNPKSALGWYRMAECLTDLEKLDQALKAANKAVEHNPKNPLYLDLQGRILMLLGNNMEALESYRLALESDSENVDALIGAAWACIMVGYHPEAMALNEKAMTIAPGNEEAERQFKALTDPDFSVTGE